MVGPDNWKRLDMRCYFFTRVESTKVESADYFMVAL